MRVLILALLFARVLARATTDWAVPGPFAVETLKVEWRDAKRQRDVPAKIYFQKNATGACPVIVFSHGLGGTREGYEYLGRHWASHGFVSVHLQHHGSDDAVWRGAAQPRQSMREATLDPLNAINRPVDVSFALDELTKMNKSDGVLRGQLDLEHVGMAGHSFGAWTTLVIAGQRIGPSGKDYSDPRIKAAIAMSAPVPRAPSENEFAHITVPVLHMTGTRDDSPVGDTAAKDRRIPFDRMTNVTEFLLTFDGGDHMLFSGSTGPLRNKSRDAAMHKLIRAGTTAFWEAYLRNDSTASAWLVNGGFGKAVGALGKLEQKPNVTR